MKVLYSWIEEFIDTGLKPEDIADRLTMAGIETSSVSFLGDGFEKIVTGRIRSVGRHPGADRLSLCVVTDGRKEYQIVCGASNIKTGDTVPLALEGAVLTGGVQIKRTKIRGTYSEGMMCSEHELGISDDHEGIMILPAELDPGTSIVDALHLNDYLMEMEITPNRGDCLSVYGIAREISAILGVPMNTPVPSFTEISKSVDEEVSIHIEDFDLCPRYSSRVLLDVEIKPSPYWLQRRLHLCGIRPINQIVDITNYLLLEFGQPMHAFDLDLIQEQRIVVKCAGNLKTFTTLDGVERAISKDTLLIWDGKRPIALAGIMGGENTEVSEKTRRVLFESAHFDPLSIRKSSKRMGLSTESSYRFERGVDPSGTLFAIDRAISILSKFSSHKVCRGFVDTRGDIPESRTVTFRPARAGKIIGMKVRKRDAEQIFSRLGFEVERGDKGEFAVSVPSYRFDITREVDLIEEVARIAGYEHVPTTYPRSCSPHQSKDHEFVDWKKSITDYLSILGVMESINLSFLSDRVLKDLSPFSEAFTEHAIAIENPISEDTRYLRPSLLPGLLKSLKTNIFRHTKDVRLFELGKVFRPSLHHKFFEENMLGVALTGFIPGEVARGEMYKSVDFYFAKSILAGLLTKLGFFNFHLVAEHTSGLYSPERSAAIKYDGKTIGYVGEVNADVAGMFDIPSEVYYIELNLDHLFNEHIPEKVFRPISKYPPVERDISFIVDTRISVGDMIEYAKRVDSDLIKVVSLFDLFKSEKLGADVKSVGLRIVYQAEDRTLTEQEVNDIHKKIVNLLENRFGAKVRSS